MRWLTFLLSFFALSSAPLLAQTTLTVRADYWAPYNGNPGEKPPGYVVEMMEAIYAPLKVKIDYQLMPWTRAVDEAGKGKVQAVIGALKADAPQLTFPQEPCGKSSIGFYTLASDAWVFSGPDSLTGKTLGVIADYSYSEQLDAYIKQHRADTKKISFTTGDSALEQSIQMLRRGRIGVFVEDLNVFEAKRAKLGLKKEDFRLAGQDNESSPIYVAFAPNLPETAKLVADWDAGVKRLRASGELAKILATYGLTDWQSTP
jgi:polar amino acid transport system substrate-binding protein